LTVSGAAFLAALQLAEKFFISESAWMTKREAVFFTTQNRAEFRPGAYQEGREKRSKLLRKAARNSNICQSLSFISRGFGV